MQVTKQLENYLKKSVKCNIFVFINFSKNFLEYIRMETQAIRMGLKDRELKDREEKIKSEIIISKDDMDK